MSGPLVITHPSSYLHHPPDHPERAERIGAIAAALAADPALRGLAMTELEIPQETSAPGATAARAAVAGVHDPGHVAHIFSAGEAAEARGTGAWLDTDTYIGPGSLEAICGSVLSAVEAVDRVLAGETDTAFSFCRPPGHHATRSQAMGFCFFNNVAAAAQRALDSGLSRVAIVDFDVHHGNGTQDIFYDRPEVLYISTHEWPQYPGTGAADERGHGAGEGFTLNLPLPAGYSDDDYARIFDQAVLPALDRYQPELLLLSAGFDAHRSDPLAGMELSTDGFGLLAHRLLDRAGRLCGGRSAWILEGGYDLDALGASVAIVVREAARIG